MSRQHPLRGVTPRQRLLAFALILGIIASMTWYWQGRSQAGSKASEPELFATRTQDRLQVLVGLDRLAQSERTGNFTLELLDKQGAVVAKQAQPIDGATVRFAFDAPAPPEARLRVSHGRLQKDFELKEVLLLKGHETAIIAGTEFHPSSPASLVCTVRGVKSLTENVGLPGSDIVVSLRNAKGETKQLAKRTTGASGVSEVPFELPAVEPGQYTLEVRTKSAFGEEKLEHQVQIKAGAKILLVADKPIYQPGQLMHLRAMMLNAFDMRPVGNKALQFEIEDGKGNKVYRKNVTTTEYGIASVDFQLADEVNMGDYHIHATSGDARADKTVQVKRYVLPKFKVEVKANKSFYQPKETVKVELQADYFFGKAVNGAKVEVSANTFDVAFREFEKWTGKTDEHGHAKFEIKLPDYFVGQPLQSGNAIVKLDIKVHDSADHTETIVKSYAVSDQPLRVNLIGEGGKLVPDMENRVFAAVTYPDGSPAANAELKVWRHKPAGIKVGAAGQPGVQADVAQAIEAAPEAPLAPVQGFNGRGLRGRVPVQQPGNEVPKAVPLTKEEEKADPGEPWAVVKTNAAGLAEFKILPKADQFRAGNHGPRDVEFMGGRQQMWTTQVLLDLRTEVKDAQGSKASAKIALNSQPLGENVLLRLNKAIYSAGDRMALDVRTSAGLPTVFVDVVRSGQIMLSRWLEVKDGKAQHQLDLPLAVFGSLEVHAYQMLASGEIIRDSRVVYVQPRSDLKIEVNADKSIYAPGEDGRIEFKVTTSEGRPAAAALGVIVVDEAVYALQDLQPGLEKVYFTLQEELLKPQVQILSQGETIDNLIRQPALPAPQQQVAEVLLTAVKLPPPPQWNMDPGLARRQRVASQIQQVGGAIQAYANGLHPVLAYDAQAKRWAFRPGLVDEMAKAQFLQPQQLEGIFADKLTLADVARIDKDFRPEKFGEAITAQRIATLSWVVGHYANTHKAKFLKGDVWTLPATAIDEAVVLQRLDKRYAQDAWNQPIRLVKRAAKVDASALQHPLYAYYDLVSPGMDGKNEETLTKVMKTPFQLGWQLGRGLGVEELRDGNGMDLRFRAARGAEGGFGGGMPKMDRMAAGAMPMNAAVPAAAARPQGEAKFAREAAASEVREEQGRRPGDTGGGAGEAPVTRVREYFPETMLWQPNLITDDQGNATMAMSFADSITTWRLSASANSLTGALGGANVPLKVFQDFFVDIDLPVALTQADEVAFPVAVYNYLKTPQRVKIQLQQEPWFELLDPQGLERALDLKPNEVTNVKFRIRANKIGVQPLLVKAIGSTKSDAVKRTVEVVPNGEKFEKVYTDRLNGRIEQTIDIPEKAIADANKLLVRIYPGVFAQVVDGLDGMMRMPGGCFEQTSSSAYPNVLIVDYIKKNKIASTKMLMQAEQYLNLGYQRLLTFERPGGGFDWWGREEPLVWLSAYGLQEFADMAKVYPVDRGIIDRTQQFLMRKRDQDGTWSNIGATHGETIASMGNPKLLLTSYVTWSLFDSGYPKDQLTNSVAFIRNNVGAANNNAYVLALAANALAAYDAKDDSTLEAIRRLDQLRKEIPDWKAINFPNAGASLTYARGDSVSIETTALAAMAMIRTGQFSTSANQALTYLVKSKQGNGTWGSTQATILALKALLAGMGGTPPKEAIPFTITVNGTEAARGRVDAENADLMQAFDLKNFKQTGANKIAIEVGGETNLMYQIVGRHFEPWKVKEVEKSPIEVSVSYDRTRLSTSDVLHAKATLKYHGKVPTYMVMLDLGIAPGFTVEAGDFAEMVDKGQIKKFSITPRQVILYLGDVKAGDELTFEYSLRPRYPLRARTAPSVAYEYNTPSVRAEAAPVELTVEEPK